jgi:hypothetical protein
LKIISPAIAAVRRRSRGAMLKVFVSAAYRAAYKKVSPLIKMKGLLHEKIQLYIYKPSISLIIVPSGQTASGGFGDN